MTVARAAFLDEIEYNPADVTPPALVLAIRLCSVPHWVARWHLKRGGWSAWQARALVMFRCFPDAFRAAAREFQAYLNNGRQAPDFWHDSKQTKECTCPTLLMIERDLMSFWHYTPAQIARMPLGEAQWRRLAILEASGAIEFKTDEEAQMLEEFKRLAKEEAEARKKEVAHGND